MTPQMLTDHANTGIMVAAGLALCLGLGLLAFGAIVPGVMLTVVAVPSGLLGYRVFQRAQEIICREEGIAVRHGGWGLVCWGEIQRIEHEGQSLLRLVLTPDARRTRGTGVIELRARFVVDLAFTTTMLDQQLGHLRRTQGRAAVDDDVFHSAMVVREGGGVKLVLMVGGSEPARVGAAVESFGTELLDRHRWNPEFDGVLEILVVPPITPDTPPLRAAMDEAVAALRRRAETRSPSSGAPIVIRWERGQDRPGDPPK